jgi:hypothetical protein
MVPNNNRSEQKLSIDRFPSNGFGGLTFYETIIDRNNPIPYKGVETNP